MAFPQKLSFVRLYTLPTADFLYWLRMLERRLQQTSGKLRIMKSS